jgi:hypothetical protein
MALRAAEDAENRAEPCGTLLYGVGDRGRYRSGAMETIRVFSASTPELLHLLAWLQQHGVQEVVMACCPPKPARKTRVARTRSRPFIDRLKAFRTAQTGHPVTAYRAQKGSARQAGNPRRDHFEKSAVAGLP